MPTTPVSSRHHNSHAGGSPAILNSSLDDSFVLPENDDLKEKNRLHQQRIRKSIHENTLQKKRIEKKQVESALSSLNDDEKTAHYNLCMKLSAENKINFKNVFGLHLIDYMADLVKKEESPNFQTASMTLQASTKIYAVRVDNLYSETVKVAGDITTKKKNKGKSDNDVAEENDIGPDGDDAGPAADDGAEGKKQKAKKKKLKSFIAPNMNSLFIQRLETVEMPHQKFQSLTRAFEDGESHGLMSQLTMKDDSCEVPLAEPYIRLQEKTPSIVEQTIDQDITKIMKFLADKVVSPTLEMFSYLVEKWPFDDDETLPQVKSSCNEQLKLAFDKIHFPDNLLGSFGTHPTTENDFCFPPPVDGDVHNTSVFDNADDNRSFFDGPDEPQGDCAPEEPQREDVDGASNGIMENSMAPQMTANESMVMNGTELSKSTYFPPLPRPSGVSVQDMKKMISSTPSGYNFADRKLEFQDLGLNILRGKSVQAQSKVKINLKKEKKPFAYFRSEDLDKEAVKKSFVPGKRITLTKSQMDHYAEADNELPPRNYHEEDLFSLFTKPISFKRTGRLMLDESVGEIDENDICDNFVSESLHEDVSGHMFEPMSENPHISLVAMPEKVKKDVISYEKIAKKIDQKLIKNAMWKVLTQTPVHSNGISSSDSSVNDEISVPVKLSHAYKVLKKRLPETMSENMSVHIAFVILLQLVNEHSLSLKSINNFTDIVIASSCRPQAVA